MSTNLSFSNYGDATTNGSQLGSLGFGVNQLNVGTPVSSNTGGGLQLSSAGVTPTETVLEKNPAIDNQQGAGGNFWSKDGGAGLVLGGVQVLGNLWNAFQQQKMAKERMSFAREQWDTNLENQTQTYNTALEDRIRARHNYTGQDEAATDSYLSKHEL